MLSYRSDSGKIPFLTAHSKRVVRIAVNVNAKRDYYSFSANTVRHHSFSGASCRRPTYENIAGLAGGRLFWNRDDA